MALDDPTDGSFGKKCKQFQIFFDVIIRYFQEVLCRNDVSSKYDLPFGKYLAYLIEVEDTGKVGIEPDGISSTLAEFLASGGGKQRCGEAISRMLGCRRIRLGFVTSNKFETSENVTPLVRPSDLNVAFVVFVEMVKVVGLKELVRELGER